MKPCLLFPCREFVVCSTGVEALQCGFLILWRVVLDFVDLAVVVNLVALVVVLMEMRSSSASMSSLENPDSSRSSVATTKAFTEPFETASRMDESFSEGLSFPRISPAPVVLGLRSDEMSISSES